MIEIKAPLSNSLFMMERELPSYLSTAYSLRYGDEAFSPEDNFVKKIYTTIQRYFSLIKELYYYQPRKSDFIKNIQKLDNDFIKMRGNIANNTKPICAYFVSSYDSNSAILGDQLYIYHHYKIRNFEKHYAVAPKVVRSQAEMYHFTAILKALNPGREIEVVDMVAHGGKSTIGIFQNPTSDTEEGTFINPSNLEENGFKYCAPNATIIIDGCETGRGHHNIADDMARKNPGKTVFAPGPSLFFSKPVISTTSCSPKIEHVVHGFAILNAYSFKRFHYAQTMPPQLPYTKDETLLSDTLKLLELQIRGTHWSEPSLDLNSEKDKVINLFQSLSHETETLIKHQIWKNHREPLDRGDDFGGDFLRANPLHETVLSAFNTVGNDMKEDLFNNDQPYSGLFKAAFWAISGLHKLKALWRKSMH